MVPECWSVGHSTEGLSVGEQKEQVSITWVTGAISRDSSDVFCLFVQKTLVSPFTAPAQGTISSGHFVSFSLNTGTCYIFPAGLNSRPACVNP